MLVQTAPFFCPDPVPTGARSMLYPDNVLEARNPIWASLQDEPHSYPVKENSSAIPLDAALPQRFDIYHQEREPNCGIKCF